MHTAVPSAGDSDPEPLQIDIGIKEVAALTTEEKLQHFYTASIDSAMQEAQQVQTQHQEALDKIFQEHKESKERQIQSHIQAETDNLKREINKTVSARQLEYRRLLSDKTEEIKQQLFHDVAERLAQFRSTPEYLEYLSQRIQEARDFAGEDALVVYLDPADQNWIPELAARFGFAPVVSREAFMGAVIRSKNILIDNSFATLLREAKEEFVFAGGMTDE